LAFYRDLIAWKKAIELVTEIYRVTAEFPKSELYGLTSQLRRAAVSVPSNIAEGRAHYSNADFRRFLRHARGSLAEVETQVLIARNLSYVPDEAAEALQKRTNELSKILAGLLASIPSKLGTRDSGLGTPPQ